MALQNLFGDLALDESSQEILTELKKKADLTETQPVSLDSSPLPTGAATESKQTDIITELSKKANLTETQPVSLSSVPLASDAAKASKQLPDGHNVTVLNPTANPETGLAKESKQLPDNHQVSVSNQPTGYATSSNQTNGTQSSKFVDESGAPYGVKHIKNKPRVSATDYLYDIAEGNVTDHTQWTKNGYNGALSNVEQTLWAVGGDYIFPATAQRMEVVSSSANDAAAGTGARTVAITYLNNLFEEKTETVTLNGTTPVLTVATDIYRVNTFRVLTVGTGNQNAGNIDIRNIADTPIYSRIATGINRALNCVFTVPKDKCLYIYNILFSAGSNVANRPVRFITKANYDNINLQLTTFFLPYSNIIITDGTCDVPIESPTRFCAGTDLKQNAISPDGAAYGSIIIRGWLETV